MPFRAFLSYSHADAAWARWLLRRLETYRVPSRLVGTQGVHGPNTGGGFLATGGGGIDKTQWAWLGAGVACLIAAATLSVRARRPRVTVPRHE